MIDPTAAAITVVTSGDLDSFCRKVLSVVSRWPVVVFSPVSSLSVVVSVTSSVSSPGVVVANEIVVDLVELEALAALCSSFLCRFSGLVVTSVTSSAVVVLASNKTALLSVEVEMIENFRPGRGETVVARGWEPANTETTSGLEMASDWDWDQLTSILGPRGLEAATWSRELRGCDPNTDNSERGTGARA